jgi:hypothetical protein
MAEPASTVANERSAKTILAALEDAPTAADSRALVEIMDLGTPTTSREERADVTDPDP